MSRRPKRNALCSICADRGWMLRPGVGGTLNPEADELREYLTSGTAELCMCAAGKGWAGCFDLDFQTYVHQPPPAVETNAWPEPLSLDITLPPVAKMSLDLIPESFRPLVGDVSERMQIPLDFAAAVAVVSLAGCVNRRARIQPKEHDHTWSVVGNLWGCIVAEPGMMKTPVFQAITKPLSRIEADWANQFASDTRAFEEEREIHEIRINAWKEKARRDVKDNKRPPKKPDDDLSMPKQRRLIVNDSTFEKLHQIMSENPAGLLVLRDELTGWLSMLEKQGREGERAFHLECWNGDGSFTVDRMQRGSVYVPACCTSMLGGIQPGRLRAFLSDALQDGPSNDGLIQRFQLMVWPDMPPDFTLIDRPPKPKALESAFNTFSKLVSLSEAKPKLLKFAPPAQERFNEWFTRLEKRIRKGEARPALISHLAKYRRLMPALSLLFELAEWVNKKSDGKCVRAKHVEQAEQWCSYLETHACRVYSCIASAKMRAAEELAKRIRKHDVELTPHLTFAARDVYRKQWAGLSSTDLVLGATEILIDSNWLRAETTHPGSSGGPKTIVFKVNPRIWDSKNAIEPLLNIYGKGTDKTDGTQ